MAISILMQQKIEQLYVKDGYSMMQISQQLGCSVSVVRYWLGKNNIKIRSISEAVNNLYATKFHKVPFELKNHLSDYDEKLKIAGTMLYWGEGAKSGNAVKFTNSDPEMIAVFIRFLVVVCGISQKRLKVLIHMYPDHNEQILKEFWSRVTGVPVNQFYKSYTHEGRIGTYKKKSPYGTLAISYSDKKLLDTLLLWISQYKQELM